MKNDRGALLLITSSFPVHGDGSEAAGSFVLDLVHEIARSTSVRVVAPGRKKTIETLSSRITIYRYSSPSRPLGTLRLWHPLDAISILRTLSSGSVAALAAARDGNVAVSLALWALPSGFWARRVCVKLGVPYMVWMLGSDIWSLGRIRILRPILKNVICGASRRFADGLQLAADSRKIAGVDVSFLPTTRAITLPSNRSPLRKSAPYRLLFLGRWHSNKGIDLLMDALGMLDDEDWNRIDGVRIFGGGDLEKLVRTEGEILRTAGRPVFVGHFVNKCEAEAEIASADYVIIPSRIESIPLVFSDAMKLQRPVIATPVGDFPALFRQAPFGILSESYFPAAIRDAIRAALRVPADAFKTGVAWHASRFDLETIANQILESVHGER